MTKVQEMRIPASVTATLNHFPPAMQQHGEVFSKWATTAAHVLLTNLLPLCFHRQFKLFLVKEKRLWDLFPAPPLIPHPPSPARASQTLTRTSPWAWASHRCQMSMDLQPELASSSQSQPWSPQLGRHLLAFCASPSPPASLSAHSSGSDSKSTVFYLNIHN